MMTIKARRSLAAILLLFSISLATPAWSADPVVRVGALEHGTVSWELNVMRHHGLDRAEGIRVEVRPLASKNAAAVALQSGAVDVIVSDWIWVSRQRHRGRAWTFYPWSMAVGSIMVNPKAGIDSPGDLANHRLGIAGGPVDKSWLLLQAYYEQKSGNEIADAVEPVFGSPPLLNKLMLRGDLSAVINYWHYSARLNAAGMEPLIEVEEMLPALGIEESVPLLGWVFSEDWASKNEEQVRAFLRASRAAKARLARSDGEWQRLRKTVEAQDDATLKALRETFRAGIPRSFGDDEIAAARELYTILAREGGKELTGGRSQLAPGTFWTPNPELAGWPR